MDDQQAAYEKGLRFLAGEEFTRWREKELDTRAAAHLDFAVNAASLMTPEGCFKAAHHLLLYASLKDMGAGSQDRARLNLYELEKPQE